MRAALRFTSRQVRARPLACFAVAFLLGLTLRRHQPVPTAVCAIVLVPAAGFGVALRKNRRWAAALLLFAGLLAGMTRMGLALDAVRPVEDRKSVEMAGRVASEPFTKADNGRRVCKFLVESLDGEPSDLRLRLYLRSDDGAPMDFIDYGQRLRLTGNLWAADPVTNPHEFDFGDYLHRQGLDGYATARIEDVAVTGAAKDLRSAIIGVRRAVSRRIDALFPRSAAMMRALVLGDRSMLSDELRDAMSRSGTAHLVSISGLHVTVLSALLALALGRFMSRRAAGLVAVALLLPYGAMIGFTAPFVRALAMFAILCFAPVAGLPSDPFTRLCAVMLAWLAAKPLSIGDAGFVLSFSAAAGILLLMPPLMRLIGVEALSRRKPSPSRARRMLLRLALYIPSVLCATLAAQLATLPAVVAFFGVQSIVSVPFNLVCVPLCMLGYILGTVALLLSAVSMPLAAALARVPDALLGALAAITRFSGTIPAASLHIGRYPVLLTIVHWLIVLAASDLSNLRPWLRRLMPLGLVAVAALSTLLVYRLSWDTGVVFLDAGQADAAVFRSRGHTFVIDAGDSYTPVADYLNATCLRLDAVVLSHPHQDHAGGLPDILNNFRPGAIYVPRGWFDAADIAPEVSAGIERARDMGVEIRELAAGDSLPLTGDARLDVYSPVGETQPEEANDLSLLAMITCEGQRMLFTGDLSALGEPLILPDADVLKVAHHGSDRATSARFLASTTPRFAVISVGENNYGHPGARTLEALSEAGAQVYQTRRCGAITMTWRRGEWHIDTYLEVQHEVE